MEFELIKELYPKYESLGKFTTIEVTETESILKAIEEIRQRFLHKVEFIPPVFSEYVISIDISRTLRKSFDEEVSELYPLLTGDEREQKIDELIQKNKDFYEENQYQKYLIRWQDEITFTVLIYFAKRKKIYLQCRYEYDVDDMTALQIGISVISDDYKRETEERGHQWLQEFCKRQVFFILAISDFMLNYTDKIQYEKIEYKPTKTINKQESKTREHRDRKLILKSKRKKYVLIDNDISEYKKRKYRKIKSSWFVRGYYERFGKDKVIKYIPPRINHRNLDKKDEPKRQDYVIKTD